MQWASLSEHLEKLRYFAAIAETGSLAKAAAVTRVAQPTLSRTVRILEEVLGAQLLLRGNRGIELTVAGTELYDYSRHILREASQIQTRIQLRADEGDENIEIGTKEPYAVHLWPSYLKSIRQTWPGLEITLRIRRYNTELRELVATEQVAMAMIPTPEPSESLVAFEPFRDRLGLFSAAPTTAASPLFVFRNGLCGENRRIGDILRKARFSGERIKDVDSFEVARAMAAHGLGSALLPLRTTRESVRSGKLLELSGQGLPPRLFDPMPVCAIVHAKNRWNKRLRSLVRLLKAPRAES